MNDTLDNKDGQQKEELVARFRAYLDSDSALESATDKHRSNKPIQGAYRAQK